ncbi:VanZ family protein [Rossellomorea sp. NPDC071047]|uniref:VanZ family protein n=1 Tax=Rossellomorea sp. NPDC071047 TaxID=3390675 RepID=UPI003D009E8F
MRLLLAFIYSIFVIIMTCTQNITKLAVEGPSFQWNPEPDFLRFFDFHSYPFHSQTYLFQKSGHVIAFYFLAFMIHFTIRKGSIGFILSVAFALFTEIAQLYFSRTGCLLDVGYDVLGISLYFILYTVNQKIMVLSSKAQSG